jgi:hypothetical protein
MPDCAERAISAIVVNPDITVRPRNYVSRDIVGIHKNTGLSLIILYTPPYHVETQTTPFESLPNPVIVMVPPTVGQFCQVDPFHLKSPYCELLTQTLP